MSFAAILFQLSTTTVFTTRAMPSTNPISMVRSEVIGEQLFSFVVTHRSGIVPTKDYPGTDILQSWSDMTALGAI